MDGFCQVLKVVFYQLKNPFPRFHSDKSTVAKHGGVLKHNIDLVNDPLELADDIWLNFPNAHCFRREQHGEGIVVWLQGTFGEMGSLEGRSSDFITERRLKETLWLSRLQFDTELVRDENYAANANSGIGIVVNLERKRGLESGWVKADPNSVRVNGFFQLSFKAEIAQPAIEPENEGKQGCSDNCGQDIFGDAGCVHSATYW